MFTRGLPSSHSMIDHVRDLETVLDASGIERCVLIARTVFGHAAVRYAVEHPERVDALVLLSVPVSGSSLTSIFTVAAQKSWDLLLAVAASTELPADRAGARWRLMQTINLDDYVVMVGSWLDSDIGDLLHRVEVPTLVLHPRDYLLRSPDEAMKVAAGIPSARFRLLEGSQPYGEVSEIVTALDSFLADLPARRARAVSDSSAVGSSVGIPGSLSVREVEVLKLLAAGRSNQQIAGELVISLNTVNRHVSNIYAKTGAANRAEAVSWAYRRGLA